MRYSTFLFDLDGTLADSVAGIQWSAHRALAEVAPEAPRCPIRELIGPPIEIFFPNYLRRHAPEKADNEAMHAQLVRHYRRHYDSEGCRRVTPFEGASETLAKLQDAGARLLIVTNKPKNPAAVVLEVLQLKQFFEAIVSPDSILPNFADKSAMVRFALQEYSLPANRTLFIGDARDDARAAHENGLDFAAMEHGYGGAHLSDEFPVRYTLARLSELTEISKN